MRRSRALLVAGLVAGALPTLTEANAARQPILGYNSYNDVACSPNSTWMESTIQALASKGFLDLGFNHFQVDCGWQAFERTANGSLTYDPDAFPDGISPLSQLASNLGMQWSMYTDQGVYSCDTRQLPQQLRPGSLGHEQEDAATFAAWGTKYVKVDNCYVQPPANAPKDPREDFPSRFGAMWTALQSAGINKMLVCQWGTPYINSQGYLEGPATWTRGIGTSYRLSDDIASGWQNVLRIMNQALHINLKDKSGAFHVADMDLLEAGNPELTYAEQQSHFSIWALFKSALVISTNVPDMSVETQRILSNRDILGINQDPLVEPVKLVQRFTGNYDVYAGPLSGGNLAVLLLDQSNATRTLSLDFRMLAIASADVKDVWNGVFETGLSSYSATVSAHGCVVLRLSNVSVSKPQPQILTYYPASSGLLSGNATFLPCGNCQTGRKVGYLSANVSSAVTLTGIRTSQSTTDVRFSYFNCEVGYTFADQGPNVRGANISVNGRLPQEVLFPLTGYDWLRDSLDNFLVRLSGFDVNSVNNITITASKYEGGMGLSGWAPDIDSIGIVA